MSCQIEQIADCGDVATLARALFINDKEDGIWLSQCTLSLSSCGNLMAVAYKNRLCLLTSQWISSTDSNTYLISWNGTLPSDVSAVLAMSICPSQHSSQNGPDWFCIIVGFKNGSVGFYTNTGHLLLLEKLDDKPVLKISCHTGTYGTLPDDVHILFQSCVCIVSGASLFQTLRNAKTQLARVKAGVQGDYSVDSRNINIRKWQFVSQETVHDAEVAGLQLQNTYDHLLAASTYGGYDTWYRSVPPVNTLVLACGIRPYIGSHYALEGGTAPPLQDVARAVANKIKSALPGWLGGGSAESASQPMEPLIKSESLAMHDSIHDLQRTGLSVCLSPDRRLAAIVDSLGRVSVLDVKRGHVVRMFKGCRDAQCAFVQIFEQDSKKPQLSVIKELRRAVFLIIYNPKKGLIDIRLMQRGSRVAVFTATKNSKLIYNTCGMVGADTTYAHKKLNLPEFQCVLIDPDGKLKKFHIPFFYALEGEHLERSKDLQILKDLRNHVKKSTPTAEDYESEIIKSAEDLKTLELKKHCLEMLIRNYEVPPKIIMRCLEIFWDSIANLTLNEKEKKIKVYFENLSLVTLFYRNIHNENTNDMREIIKKIYPECGEDDLKNPTINDLKNNTDDKGEIEFQLLEDDSCILERLFILAHEHNYKEHHHAKVTFADKNTSTYKHFVSSFMIDEKSEYLSLKTDLSQEKTVTLASDLFKAIFKIKNKSMLTNFVKSSRVDAKEIVKLIILHVMNMRLEEINVDLIDNIIEVLYYVSCGSKEAVQIPYNEISIWWEDVRSLLVEMSCPLRSMVVAMACKAVGKIFETKRSGAEDAWESVSKENAKWGILIGKLEDISILGIILLFKGSFKDSPLPKLYFEEFNINLKYIYTRGKGSVTELIAKWLCGMGVLPEAIVANELIDILTEVDESDDDNPQLLFIENNRRHVDENQEIFKWLSLLRRQFPLSSKADYVIANMCWEYAMAWQNDAQKIEKLTAVVQCLTLISDVYLKLGLYSIIWSTYIKHTFELSCRLVNKVGKLPKELLCLQDVGLFNVNLIKFLEATTKYLHDFKNCSSTNDEKREVRYEKIWEESVPSLVEVAQDRKIVNSDILNLNYQMSCAIYYQCHFNFKFSKPLDNLFDVDYQYVVEALAGNTVERPINMKVSEKLRSPRMKFITKLVRAAVETVATVEVRGVEKTYNNEECVRWMERVTNLADMWEVEEDFVNHQQAIALYHTGYDSLAEHAIELVKEPESLLTPIIAISTQRLKRSLEQSPNPPEWIVSVPPHLYKRMQNVELDTSIPAHPCLPTTVRVLQKLRGQVYEKSGDSPAALQNVKLAELIIGACEVIIRNNL